ncbi:MAG: FkbM family methyltransferase [Sneathiellaceae bacterium]
MTEPAAAATPAASEDSLDLIFASLPDTRSQHSPYTPLHRLLKRVARQEIERRFADTGHTARPFGPFGELRFPYHAMGSIDSLNLFDYNELMIFAFYDRNRGRYAKALDLGANLGLHSIMLSRCFAEVRSFEPDPVHYELLTANLARNGCGNVAAIRAAASIQDGEAEFVRVKGNTTGSHLAGAKKNPYGELDRFTVEVRDVTAEIAWADLVKLDIEGHEGELITGIDAGIWAGVDAIVEIGTPENAERVFAHFDGTPVRLYSQHLGWNRVEAAAQMPTSHRDGSLFMTTGDGVPW